ncbi:MAG: hypothetical protein PGN37_13550 [Mycobacterium kyogaense]|uniref:hypothetical protein n=1 Tax=Mycobacterium kyogaense TaxID=2212479 RepID=UPI002FF548E9
MKASHRLILNGYRAAASAMADARSLHETHGATDNVLIAYRLAALKMAAAHQLDRQENTHA